MGLDGRQLLIGLVGLSGKVSHRSFELEDVASVVLWYRVVLVYAPVDTCFYSVQRYV